jgi:ParB family chromosome partitioning protein
MSVKKRGLGRGLDALLGEQSPSSLSAESQSGSGEALRHIAITQLDHNPFQPRRRIDPNAIEELAASIRANGILQPLVVRRSADGRYQILAGERRWRAAQQCGLGEVPALVRDVNDQQMLELALIENLQREELNAVEEARAYRQLVEQFEMTQEQVADRVGKSRVAVTNALRLLKLPDQLLTWIEEGQLSAGHARALLALDSGDAQTALAREAMRRGLSVRELERRVRHAVKPPRARGTAEPDLTAQARELEQRLTAHLGLLSKIHPSSNAAGKIEVYYASLDEFQRFFEVVGLPTE